MAMAAHPLGSFLAAQGRLLPDVRRSLIFMGYIGPATALPWRVKFVLLCPPILAYLRTPADNERGPQHTEHLLADLMQTNTRGLAASLLYTTVAGETILALDVASPLLTPATTALSAHYPGVRVTGPGQNDPDEGEIHTVYLRLVPDVRSLRTAADFEDGLQRTLTEPISGLLAAVADRHDGLNASIRLTLERVSSSQRHRARRVAALATGPLSHWFRRLSIVLPCEPMVLFGNAFSFGPAGNSRPES